MNTMKWLIRREMWEHKGMFLWAPLVTAALIFVAAFGASWVSSQGKFNGITISVNGQNTHVRAAALPQEIGEQVGSVIATGYVVPVAPLMVLMAVAVFFYSLGSLYDERRDRSILFWKSLPVSDRDTVLSKVVTAAVLVPLGYLLVGIVLSVLVLLATGLVMASFKGVNLLPWVLSNGAAYTTPLYLVGLVPVYVVWALPTIGWLMLVSSWARSKVIIWAIAVPLIALLLVNYVQWLAGGAPVLDWVGQYVIPRALVGVFPGTWIGFENIDLNLAVDPVTHVISPAKVFAASWRSLLGVQAVAGAAAGVAMIAAAVRIRRWRDEG